MGEELFLIKARSAALNLTCNEFEAYITSNEAFNQFMKANIELSPTFIEENPKYRLYLQAIFSTEKVGESLKEDRAIEGIKETVQFDGSAVVVGFSRVREEFVYIKVQETYFRGIKVFFGDLGKITNLGVTPLDKTVGNGNYEILLWNKRKNVSEVRFIHNKIESIMYVVDNVFDSFEEVEADMINPQDINLSKILLPLLL